MRRVHKPSLLQYRLGVISPLIRCLLYSSVVNKDGYSCVESVVVGAYGTAFQESRSVSCLMSYTNESHIGSRTKRF